MTKTLKIPSEIWIIYDDECPICSAYCQYIRLQETIEHVHLVNARYQSEIMDRITASGFDIDKGMVVIFNDSMYYGADAVNVLALLSTPSNFLNWINCRIFRLETLSKLFYPILKFIRQIILRILRVDYIDNLKKTD